MWCNRVVPDDVDAILREQASYYRERAPEYDDWWFRRGRYDRGRANEAWFAQVGELERWVDAHAPLGDVLELACGTGLWTRRLAVHAGSLTALDASPQVRAIARARVPDQHVSFAEADLFDWEPSDVYDTCFFGFWLSHVPEDRFDMFWERVARSLRPGGRVLFVDSLPSPLSAARDHVAADPAAQTTVRHLNDGRSFTIVKRFHDPLLLAERLRGLGWHADVSATSEFFLYGEATHDA